MSLNRGRKLRNFPTVFIICGIFLFVLVIKNVSAASVVTTYQKLPNGTLQAADWNSLLYDSVNDPSFSYPGGGDFVNTWLPAKMVGPLGINTVAPTDGSRLNVNGVIEASSLWSLNTIGIGTTNPGTTFDVVSPNNSSIFAGNKTISNVGLPIASADSATKGYVDSAFTTLVAGSFWGGSLSGNIWNINTGNTGIGTTAPDRPLTIFNTDVSKSYQMSIGYSSIYKYDIGRDDPTGALKFYGVQSGYDGYIFSGVSGEKMRILANGNIGIGTTNPGNLLEIYKIPTTNTTLQPMLTLNSDFGSAVGTGFGSSIVFRGRTAGNVMQDNAQIAAYNENNADNGYALGFYTRPSVGGGLTQNMTILRDGNVGIGNTNPLTTLDIVSVNNSSIFAGGKVISNVGMPMISADAATKGYVDSAIFIATSTITSTGKLVGLTNNVYSGNNTGTNGNVNGYAKADSICAIDQPGTHVCSPAEMLNTLLVSPGSISSEDAWIFVGPPGYLALANDCDARTSIDSATTYGAIWQGKATPYPEGRGLLKHCNESAKLACCK